MSDQTPPTPKHPPRRCRNPSQPAPVAPPAGQSGGVTINTGGGPVNVGHSIVGDDQIITNAPTGGGGGQSGGAAGKAGPSAGELFVKSSWANGLFYLFAFLAIIGVLGWVAQMVDFTTLALIVIAGIVAIPVLGALQLRMDKRLSEKSFLALMKMSIAQLPVIGGLVKK